LKFLLDENVPVSIKDVIHDLGFNVYTLHDFNMLGIQNGEVAKLAPLNIVIRNRRVGTQHSFIKSIGIILYLIANSMYWK